MKLTDFPKWAPSGLVEIYMERADLNKLVDDMVSWRAPKKNKRRGLLSEIDVPPVVDELAFKSRCLFQELWLNWYNEEGKLLTHGEAKDIWATVETLLSHLFSVLIIRSAEVLSKCSPVVV